MLHTIHIHKKEDILQPIVGGEEFQATIQMVKQAILLSKPKKSPGLDGVTADFFKVLINGGKGDVSNKHDILKLLTIYFNNILNGKISQHEAHILLRVQFKICSEIYLQSCSFNHNFLLG